MLRVTQAATTEPVGLDEAKLLLRIDHSAFDTLLPVLLTAAREVVERQTGYALADAVYEWTPEGERKSPLPIMPGQITSAENAYPILFKAEPGPAPAALKIVIVMIAGDILAHPEATADKVLSENPALQRMIFPYRRVLP